MTKAWKMSFYTFQFHGLTFGGNHKHQPNWFSRARGVLHRGNICNRSVLHGGNPSWLRAWFLRTGSVLRSMLTLGIQKLRWCVMWRAIPFIIRSWFLRTKGVLQGGAFLLRFRTPKLRPEHDSALHCHPTFVKNIPDTPLERRSMRIDRTKDQKSFHVTTFFTGTFLLVCLQPVAGLPKVWSRQREPRASAHILNAEATSPHLTHIWICNIWDGIFCFKPLKL